MFEYQQYVDQDDTFIGGEAVPVGAAARVTVPNNKDNNYNSSYLVIVTIVTKPVVLTIM